MKKKQTITKHKPIKLIKFVPELIKLKIKKPVLFSP